MGESGLGGRPDAYRDMLREVAEPTDDRREEYRRSDFPMSVPVSMSLIWRQIEG
jgi:hypothetical protein